MIGYLKGIVKYSSDTLCIILCNGVGYEVNILKSIEHDTETELFIKTIVRENDISLYGFSDLNEKKMFEELLCINGIGPKAAMNILSNISVEDLVNAIISDNVVEMIKIKGIGKKAAEKIIFGLKDKFNKDKINIVSKGIDKKENELVQALVFMGYSDKDANDIANKIYDENKTIEQLIKEALILAKK